MEDGLQDFVVLRCFDGEEFRVPSALARRSEVVVTAGAGMGGAGEHVVPVPGAVAGRVLAAVIAYWRDRDGAADCGRYDEEYVAGLSHDMRVDVINAAYHLDERSLLELFGSSPSSVASCA